MRAFAVLSCLIASTLAYNITSPNTSQGWNNDGDQTLSWQRVDTDPTTFAVVLFNPSSQTSTLIGSSVDGKSGSVKVSPPSGTQWPTGKGFRVRIVRDPQSLTALLAESQDFDIEDVPAASRTAKTNSPTNTASGSGGQPSRTPGAASSLTASTGLVALMSLLGVALV